MTVQELINALSCADPNAEIEALIPIYQEATDAPDRHIIECVESEGDRVFLVIGGDQKS